VKKRYVIAIPGGVKTGGPEALHQLCAMMRLQNMDAAVLYYGHRDPNIIESYAKIYGNPEFRGGVDGTAILIIPEAEDPALWKAMGWQTLCVWWLSATRVYPLDDYFELYHCFQSFYARKHCEIFGLRGIMLTDYLAETKLHPVHEKSPKCNVILINHRSAHLVKFIAKALPEFEICLLAGMDHSRVITEMLRGKVYVDVGWHPGRDRMPREAAMAGCIVITGNFGASSGDDIPIPSEFKLANLTIEDLCRLIRMSIENYEEYYRRFEYYRHWIRQQEKEFQREVAELSAFFEAKPCSIGFNRPDFDAEWISKERELQFLRNALSRTGVVEAVCLQALQLRIFALKYFASKVIARFKNISARALQANRRK